MTDYMQSSYRNWELENPPAHNIPIPQNYFQTNCQSIIPMLLKNIGTTLGQYASWE